ncbi:iron donor protein CyaY [Uliginosibacterium aquaticum]|uniref:Iron-sulfur cluster assembly protein CyaY n=1 Tax=Uliginosibacterium aquaticum TaxID=2731212 RepID=A0ABX2IGG9_9RHOO|nr:iron donor protein CyaY [Uliginosibacterium aquaticum]NSL55850.1 iron donor protein CyaY [Uliginosibacterium aquaticum]
MDEAEFLALAEAVLARLEASIERAAEAAGVDIDLEPQEGGILKLEFDNRSQIIINRHAAAREIWVAARSGGFHFRCEGEQWVGTRDGAELYAMLSGLISEQAGEQVQLLH